MVEMLGSGDVLPSLTSGVPCPGERSHAPESGRGAKVGAALLDAVNAYADANGGGEGYFPVPDAGLHIVRSFRQVKNHYVYRPSLCITLQGAKEILIGDETLSYGAMQCMVVGLDLPACGRVVAACADKPFVGITIEFDVLMMREILELLGPIPDVTAEPGRSMFVADVEGSLAECVLRMIKLTEAPKGIEILYPAALREFFFWLLSGPHAADLCRQALPETHLQRIGAAIHLLRNNFAETLRVERLAGAANMSMSSFHQHFKTLTSMTPLQYQKQLRLLEARRLLMEEAVNVAEAAYQVGYESPSQFSREYSRAFGVAPKRDTMKLGAAVV